MLAKPSKTLFRAVIFAKYEAFIQQSCKNAELFFVWLLTILKNWYIIMDNRIGKNRRKNKSERVYPAGVKR
jgi:hypothetical protein